MGRIVRIILIGIGFVSLGLGVIGIVLPILPTTPFLLLASFCFMKGSAKFDAWFRSSGIYKKHLDNFIRERALTVRAKITILLFADAMIAIPFIRFDHLFVRIPLLLIVIYKYYYFIVKIKNKAAE